MQRLYAPWRETYITKIIDKQKTCTFCRILAEKKDKQNLVFIRGEKAYAVLNLYPYSNGHCLIVPNRHVNDISKLTKVEYQEMMDLLLEVKESIQEAFAPQGFNVGLNLGRIAGAGIPGHVHMHIVPRWKGDHNFMPLTAGTKIISQSLTVVYQRLVRCVHAKTLKR